MMMKIRCLCKVYRKDVDLIEKIIKGLYGSCFIVPVYTDFVLIVFSFNVTKSRSGVFRIYI